MNVLGKLIGIGTGYALDGAGGALVGAVAGHFVDMYTTWASVQASRARAARGTANSQDRRNAGSRYNFTLCVVSLGAKLAKVDGAVSKAEIAAFKEVFRVPSEELHNVGMMFDRARTTARGFEAFAEQLSHMFTDNRSTLDEVVTCLFHVALADGPMKPQEVDFIRRVSKIFGFSDSYFQRRMEEQIAAYGGNYQNQSQAGGRQYQNQGQNGSSRGNQQQGRRSPEPATDPYAVLGVPASSTDKDIKIRYRTLVRENHPDSMVAAGKSKDMVAQATAKLARINAAYDQILKERHL